MAILVRVLIVSVLCLASYYAWQYTPQLFAGTFAREFGMLLSFAGVVLLLGLAGLLLSASRRFLPE